LAVYDVARGIVLKQVLIGPEENEIPAAARALEALDFQGQIVLVDALHAQRALATQILAGGGDDVFRVKGSHPALEAEIALTFDPVVPLAPGHTVPPLSFTQAQSRDQAHGRREIRTLITTPDLSQYLDWPGVQQVFKLTRSRHSLATQVTEIKVVYGLTSLPPKRASAAQLPTLNRRYWTIENKLHCPRDVFLAEGATRMSAPAQGLDWATLKNLILARAYHSGFPTLPDFLAILSAYLARIFEPFRDFGRALKVHCTSLDPC
jgi:predicted transposase YbfD/YdcC